MSVESTIASWPERTRVAVAAYQAAIRRRADWHRAVKAAVDAADAFDEARKQTQEAEANVE